jgi:hypothetical protein
LWFPFQVVRDVRDGSGRPAARLGLGLWWACWLTFLVISRVTDRLSATDDVDVIDALPPLETISAVAAVIGCALWCRIVLGITDSQEEALAPH